MSAFEPCAIANSECEAPANAMSLYGARLVVCFECGRKVCRGCSLLDLYLGRKHRLCADCMDEIVEDLREDARA